MSELPVFHRVAEVLIMGSFMVGQSVAFAPAYDKAVLAARRIFVLLNRKSLIDSSDKQTGKILVTAN